jgi:hypothetical protein
MGLMAKFCEGCPAARECLGEIVGIETVDPPSGHEAGREIKVLVDEQGRQSTLLDVGPLAFSHVEYRIQECDHSGAEDNNPPAYCHAIGSLVVKRSSKSRRLLERLTIF